MGQMFPHLPHRSILEDLRNTRSIELTVDNILEGRVVSEISVGISYHHSHTQQMHSKCYSGKIGGGGGTSIIEGGGDVPLDRV